MRDIIPLILMFAVIAIALVLIISPRSWYDEVDLNPMGTFVCQESHGWFFQNRKRQCAGWGSNE